MGKDGAFLSDFMAFQEDAFKEQLCLIVVWQVNHSLNNDDENLPSTSPESKCVCALLMTEEGLLCDIITKKKG